MFFFQNKFYEYFPVVFINKKYVFILEVNKIKKNVKFKNKKQVLKIDKNEII